VPTPKVIENKEMEQTEAYATLIHTVEEIFKSTIQSLSKEVRKLSATIKDQTKQYKTLKKEFNTLKDDYADLKNTVESLKAETPAMIST
jgi:predicted  nucleic acid-binding Zn-ribbon protein